MKKKNLAFDELIYVRTVRIVVERLQDCYAALGIVHTIFVIYPMNLMIIFCQSKTKWLPKSILYGNGPEGGNR